MAINERASAKIKLGLDTKNKRWDGYHDLSMVMMSIDLCDYVTVDHIDDNRLSLPQTVRKYLLTKIMMFIR